MKKIIIKKTFPYDPTFEKKFSQYDGYTQITTQKKDPKILPQKQVKITHEVRLILSSSLRRATETGEITATKLKITNKNLHELNEIKFDLKKLLTKNEYDKQGSNLVRKRFIAAFMNDELLETRRDIKGKIDRLFTKLNKLPDGEYLLISHSFFMKILQIYLKNDALFTSPKILETYFDYSKKTFEFFEGFEFELP